ncbi:phosphatase PAP2 family protein [Agromyces sp. MMS24-JH15]|uniref:phosphatase PAP2 family protein n=1 Tax=Agromyces sp. MMS24-JH15 TaxID=3243765 RepID=UPI003749FF51
MTDPESPARGPVHGISTATPAAGREARVLRFSRRIPLIAGLSAVGVGFLLGLVIMVRAGGLPVELDEEWAEEVLTLHGPVGDVVALFMDWLGGGLMGVIVIPIGVAVLLIALGRPWGALYFVLASALSAAAVQVLKEFFGRARPEDMLVTSDYGSFPSGHVANATTIAVAVAVLVPRAWVIVAGAAYVLLMAISRTYLGVHWITDTIGGMLVGAGAALIVWACLAIPLERERQRRRARISARNADAAQSHVTPPERPRAPGGESAGGPPPGPSSGSRPGPTPGLPPGAGSGASDSSRT